MDHYKTVDHCSSDCLHWKHKHFDVNTTDSLNCLVDCWIDCLIYDLIYCLIDGLIDGLIDSLTDDLIGCSSEHLTAYSFET